MDGEEVRFGWGRSEFGGNARGGGGGGSGKGR